MTDTTPGGFADTPGPDATAEQDADVRALLSFLRDEPLEMPADVRARIEAVLAEERRAGRQAPTGGAAALGGEAEDRSGRGAPVTVLPTGAARRGGSARVLRVVGGLAAAVLVVLGGVTLLRGTTGGASSTAGLAEASASSAASAAGTRVTASGTSYAQASLAVQARSLATAARSADVQKEPATAVPAAPSPTSASAGGTTFAAALTPDVATLCVRILTDGDGSTAIAVDSGSYAGHPAVVVVVPTQGDPASLDVFVVKPGCGTGSADILEFQRIPAS